ncbi:MAG: G1 family glutamic endopeptidase [Thermoguttaceae bacterium]|jgi:hypothetical protein
MWPRLFHSAPSSSRRKSKQNGYRRPLRLERLENRTLLSVVPVTASVTVANKVYNDTSVASITGWALSGVPAGDGVSLTGGTATFATAAVGTGITVTVTGLSLTGPNAANCVLASTTVTTTANITPATVTGIVTVANKVYDGTTKGTIIGEALNGVLGSDAVSLAGGTATFATAAVGTGITVTVTGLSLTGANAGDYVLASTTVTTTASITSGAQKKSTISANWAGYVAATDLNQPQSGSVSAVSGSWHVPAVTGTGTAYSAVWVGMDGYNSSTVEQIGTESDLINGRPQYSVWYEMYPQSSVAITTMTVSPGDSISASVQYVASGANAGQFKVTIADMSRPNDSFTTYQSASGAQRSSAEWIVEVPSSSSGVVPLANFASVTFTNASATINGVTGPIDSSNWEESAINIANSAQPETSTSGLIDAGRASIFTVTYVNSGWTPFKGWQSGGINWPLARPLCFAKWP